MNYFEVIPASSQFHGHEPLTYSCGEELAPGQIVSVGLRNKTCLGIVIKQSDKPEFKTVAIKKAFDGLILPAPQLQLLLWMVQFYPGYLSTTAQLFAPAILEKLKSTDLHKNAVTPKTSSLPTMTKEQKQAYQIVSSKKHKSYIIHGVTGSGKTRLYIELALDNIKQGKSVIILTPEISLTAPIANQFQKIFGGHAKISHSSLTPKQKRELWQEVFTSKQPMVVIGPRSSLFLPLKNLGLIVVDEFHEPAYKQESSPFYHANRVASKLAELSSAQVAFGSATPPINDYYLALRKNVPVINLKYPAITQKTAPNKYKIVDLLNKDENSGQPLISKTLISHLEHALKKGEQAMLFINKRGSARSVSCQDCGYRETCPNCDLPMVYHADEHIVRCHTCGYKKAPPNKCPECSSIRIYFSSPGTKAIVDSLTRMFPKAKVNRFDKDNKKSERLENIYDSVLKDVDIIVGTQLIAKGHDLPRLSLVAMLLAENGLDFPDFSSQERSYQLIKQLSGRVNRGHREGLFLIQTFKKDNELIKSALSESWDKFFETEIRQRKKHGFPPFYSALKIESSRKTRRSAEESLLKLMFHLKNSHTGVEFLGPSPSFVEKKASKWHWQLLVKARNRADLTALAKDIPGSFRVDIDPANFL